LSPAKPISFSILHRVGLVAGFFKSRSFNDIKPLLFAQANRAVLRKVLS
jgi:hypothetical protein